MAGSSKIEWTDATWNPVRGCSRVSEGCRNCYAERMCARGLPGLCSPTTGRSFAVKRRNGEPAWTGEVELIESALELPLTWRKPRKIFVNSMSDLFHESLPDAAIDRVFAVMAQCPRHTFQVLTKRAGRMLKYFQRLRPDGDGFITRDARGYESSTFVGNPGRWPLPNVHLGVSVENQAAADARIAQLLMTPAAVRFVSAEPMLGRLNLRRIEYEPQGSGGAVFINAVSGLSVSLCGQQTLPRIDWLICGGESGPGARPMQAEWAQSLRDQCVAAGVPFFFKQWGEWLPGDQDGAVTEQGQSLNCSNELIRLGKHAAGRLLDGRQWNEMPEVRS